MIARTPVSVSEFYRNHPDCILLHGISAKGAHDTSDRSLNERAHYAYQNVSSCVAVRKGQMTQDKIFASTGLVVGSGNIWSADSEDCGFPQGVKVSDIVPGISIDFDQVIKNTVGYNEFLLAEMQALAIYFVIDDTRIRDPDFINNGLKASGLPLVAINSNEMFGATMTGHHINFDIIKRLWIDPSKGQICQL